MNWQESKLGHTNVRSVLSNRPTIIKVVPSQAEDMSHYSFLHICLSFWFALLLLIWVVFLLLRNHQMGRGPGNSASASERVPLLNHEASFCKTHHGISFHLLISLWFCFDFEFFWMIHVLGSSHPLFYMNLFAFPLCMMLFLEERCKLGVSSICMLLKIGCIWPCSNFGILHNDVSTFTKKRRSKEIVLLFDTCRKNLYFYI